MELSKEGCCLLTRWGQRALLLQHVRSVALDMEARDAAEFSHSGPIVRRFRRRGGGDHDGASCMVRRKDCSLTEMARMRERCRAGCESSVRRLCHSAWVG